MAFSIETHGYLKIGNDADRTTVASILYKNSYTVSPVRIKRGKTYEYLVEYEMKPRDIQEEDGM